MFQDGFVWKRELTIFLVFFCAGDIGGVMLSNNSDYNTSGQDYMAASSQYPFAPLNQSNNSNPFSVPPYNLHSSMPNPPMNNTNPQMQQPYYPPPMQPPLPMNSGYMPTYIPKSENVTNIPSSSSSGGTLGGAGRGNARPGPGFAAGLGAGAVLGAGAGLYGGEYMSGFDLPSTLPHPSVSISIDPPF